MIFDGAPTVIGHRGLGAGAVPLPAPSSGAEPDHVAENTLPSVLAAVAAGLRWVEIDVTRTADDRLVLRHDPTLPSGRFIVDLPAAETGLPLLTDVLAEIPTDVAVDIDVKTIVEDAVDAPSRRTGALLAPVLRAEARRRDLAVTSFDPSLLAHLRESVPAVPVGLLTWLRFPLWHALPAAANLGFQAVGLHTASCGEHPDTRLRPLEHNVAAAHKAGLEVLVWCPKAADVLTYANAGVDALVVNEVPESLEALRAIV